VPSALAFMILNAVMTEYSQSTSKTTHVYIIILRDDSLLPT